VEPIALAKCWSLDDGAVCLLTKISEHTWELRVSRGPRLLRVEVFGDLHAAVTAAAAWRAQLVADARIA